jgi:ABC-type oligopeptide transport system substrate-binding subunit
VRLLRPAAAALLAAFIAACTQAPESASPGPSPTSSSTTGAPTPSAAAGDTEPDPSESQEEQAPGGDDDVLSVAIAAPQTLDPMTMSDPASTLVARQLFEGLTRWDQSKETVRRAAAKSWRAMNGGRRFIFTLRKGMTFHDGTRVDAADFKFAFDRIARRENASAIAFLLEDVAGFDRFNGRGRGSGLRGVKARNRTTLVISLSRPNYNLPAILTHPALVPLPDSGRRPARRPVGNGPFRMPRPWEPGSDLVLDTFDDFYREPRLDGIRFRVYEDPALAWIPFTNGEIHVAEVPVGRYADAAGEYGAEPVPLLSSYYFGLNLESRALKSLRIRRAVTFAIDPARIRDQIYKGAMRSARGIVPAGMPGARGNACKSFCTHAPARAKRLMRRVPKRARDLFLEFTHGSPHQRVAERVARDLESVRFDVAIRGMSLRRYVRVLTRGAAGLFRLGWIAEYPSPGAVLDPLFRSTSPNNYTGFDSRRVDTLLSRARAEARDRVRARLYRRAERAILRAAPIVPIGSFVARWAVQPNVAGVEFDVMGGFDAAPVSIDG